MTDGFRAEPGGGSLGERARAAAALDDLVVPVMDSYPDPSVGAATGALVTDMAELMHEARASMQAAADLFDATFSAYDEVDGVVGQSVHSFDHELEEGL